MGRPQVSKTQRYGNRNDGVELFDGKRKICSLFLIIDTV